MIVDDHEIFRNGLKMVINKLKYARVIAEAPDGKKFLELLPHAQPDIVFLDIQMPGINGIEATRKAMEIKPDLKIIALTMFNDDDYIQQMIEAGVKGFLIKNVTREIIEKAIQTVSEGQHYYAEELFPFFTRQLSKEEKSPTPSPSLTRREKEILQLIAEGMTTKEIADNLHISERTVVGHKTNLMTKTGCKNTTSLLAMAIKNKWVKL